MRTIDSLWVEHLTELDDMRRGIGLRGYAQQDPLNEFRREAYRMYEELRGLIRHGVASSIFRVTVQRQPPPTAGLARSLADGAAAAARRVAPVATATARLRHAGTPVAGRRRRPCRRLGDPARRAAGRSGGAQRDRVARRSPGDRRVGERQRRGRRGRGATGLHADGRSDRAQRPVLVRVGGQVQEVPRPLSG